MVDRIMLAGAFTRCGQVYIVSSFGIGCIGKRTPNLVQPMHLMLVVKS